MSNQNETAQLDVNEFHLGQILPELNDEDLAELAKNMIENAKTIAELKDITRDELEAVYHIAYQTYASGDYQQAAPIFRFLCFLDHLEFKYWLGLGSCRQMLEQYDDAIEAYTFAMFLDCDDPRPPFHAAECHLALGNREAAISGLTAAMEWAGDRPEHAALCARANNLMAVLNATAAQ